ncbi:UPF0001 protein [Saliniradius amylolyticus]|uniref:Pyridoxal phosphate homeostasis protein n=1 Tax=Saliniradius amylolyticus TaxID=2183582 RepID=A0A2S2E5E0_9ALTE|nr:YggS family pyridoxal phosphate-dependent enzyme [Saliniradius amylolyticus]AWL12875.1 UPF0001 protein [Saliniradius amylolyticus]
MTNTIASRLENIRSRIACNLQQAGRDSNFITLLAVSKTKPVSDIQQAYAAGQRQFGENYAQEAVEKIQLLSHLEDIQWHFIGPLQSNKTRIVAENFDWVQSVEREKIARRLNDQRPAEKAPLQVLLQVNISDEASKSGLTPDGVLELADKVAAMDNLVLRGLMTIPAKQDQAALEQDFARMYALYERLKHEYPQVDTLSMGMSGDMEEAIKAGSTMVRLGSAIFGARD